MKTESNSDNPHYWRKYDFIADPFKRNMQDNVYISSTWEDYLDLFPQFTRYCNTLVLITGAEGVGKTTLIKQFIVEHRLGVQSRRCFGYNIGQ